MTDGPWTEFQKKAAPVEDGPWKEFQKPGKRRSLEEARAAQLAGATEPQPAELPDLLPKVSQPNAYGLGAADTGGMGFADEAGAALMAGAGKLGLLPGGDSPSYGLIRDQMRGQAEGAQQQHPNSFLTGQVGGAIAQALATRGAGFGSTAETLLGKVLGGAATGGLYGGLHGFGSGEGVEDRTVQSAKEGGIGAVVGGAFPLLAAGTSKAYHSIVDLLAGNRAAKEAGTSPEVLRMLGNALDADGTRGAVGQSNMAAAGPDAMLADAGPNAKAILDTAIQRGGPGAVSARDAIAQRTDRASTAITDALDNALGAPEGVTATQSAIRTGSAPARSAAYDAAYAAPIDYAAPEGQAIEQMVKGRVPKSAIDAANELMRTEGASSKQILAKMADDGSVVFETLPDVRQLDYITRGLNEVADQADGAGKLGGTTAKGRAYSNLSKEIRDTLKGLVPEYGQALETAADPIRRSKAVELGSKLLSPSMTRDQVDEAVRGFTAPEKDALAQGIRSRLDDMVANVTRTVQDGDTGAREAVKAIKDLSSRANREKLVAAIGDTKAEALFAEIDRAAKSFDLRASVAENSKTYARLATDRKIGEMTAPGPVGKLAQGEPVNAVRKIVQMLTGQTPDKIAGRQDAIYSQIAEALTRGQGKSQPLFDAIDSLGKTDASTKLMTDRIVRALSSQSLAYPTNVLARDKLLGGQRR